jgi:hypothetical protein
LLVSDDPYLASGAKPDMSLSERERSGGFLAVGVLATTHAEGTPQFTYVGVATDGVRRNNKNTNA